jgi:predicted nucleic acid-binding protein
MTSVLDTTALSAAMRHDNELTTFLKARRPGDVVTVPPAVAEIENGIQRLPAGAKRSLLESEKGRLLSAIRVLPWTAEASVRFGSIKAHLEHSGQPVDDPDVAIAAIALAHGAAVVTANLVHFSLVPDLVVRHWRDA